MQFEQMQGETLGSHGLTKPWTYHNVNHTIEIRTQCETRLQDVGKNHSKLP